MAAGERHRAGSQAARGRDHSQPVWGHTGTWDQWELGEGKFNSSNSLIITSSSCFQPCSIVEIPFASLPIFFNVPYFSRCQRDLFQPLMVYQGKICTAQFMKLFSTSLPNSKIIQSKYKLAFDDATLRGLRIQSLLSSEFTLPWGPSFPV